MCMCMSKCGLLMNYCEIIWIYVSNCELLMTYGDYVMIYGVNVVIYCDM